MGVGSEGRGEAIPFLFIDTSASLVVVTGALVGTSGRSNFSSTLSGTVLGASGRSSTANCWKYYEFSQLPCNKNLWGKDASIAYTCLNIPDFEFITSIFNN